MNSLIIGNGSISEALENNMCSKGIFVEVISFRTFLRIIIINHLIFKDLIEFFLLA